MGDATAVSKVQRGRTVHFTPPGRRGDHPRRPARRPVVGANPAVVRRPVDGLAARRRGRRGRRVDAVAALAFDNARLRATIRRRAQDQSILLRVSQAATSSLDGGGVLAEIARACVGVDGAERCAIEIWRPETDGLELKAEAAVSGWPRNSQPETSYPLGRWSAIREAVESGRPVCFHGNDPRLVDPAHGSRFAADVRSAMMAPMLAGRECVGLLWLTARRPHAFSPRGVRLAQEIAAQTALAAQNARLLEGARRRTEEQAALLRVSRAASSGHELTAVLPQVARECLGASGVEGATIEVWDPVAEETRVVARAFIPGWPAHGVLGARFSVRDRPAVRSVLETREPLIHTGGGSSISNGDREALAVDGLESLLIVPVLFGTDCRGAVTLLSRRPGAFPLGTLWFAQDLAAQIAQAMERARIHTALREQAKTDGLTGLLNHRAIIETLDRELTSARRRGGSLAVLLIDLDDFKLFNDTHGHITGDLVLRDVAALLRSCVREVDAVGRYGGDEFLLVLPDTDLAGAARVADRLLARAALRTLPVGELRLPLRLSVGPATYPGEGDTRQTLIARADAAMYAAKDAGGGKVGTPGRGTGTFQLTTYGALTGLVKAVDRKDRYTKEHSEVVATLANAAGRYLGLPATEREALDIAARLHDVGKIAVPDAVLRKPGRLSPDETRLLRQHVDFGELIVQGVPHAALVRAAIAAHHEWWDGTGYPRGLAGMAIPLLGRVLAMADAWAAMTADRPYRKGQPPSRAALELRGGAGAQFDPSLVVPFLAALVELGIITEVPQDPAIEMASPPPMLEAPVVGMPVRTTTDRLRPVAR